MLFKRVSKCWVKIGVIFNFIICIALYSREGKTIFNKPKKLKRISYDTISYIQIETESIRDANDKMMIASYCCNKLETVEWYIKLLEAGSEKYIVPQDMNELKRIREQLIACHKQIMNVKITRPGDRPIVDIKYPKGYEG